MATLEERRHSAAHMTARAVMNLFDDVQVDIGPATADGFYYDILATDRSMVKVATIASFWPLLADMPTQEMADRLIEKLDEPQAFGAAGQ